jgi:hypothetical protein
MTPTNALPALDRDAARRRLLAQTGFAEAEHILLPGDASTRRYTRLILPGRSAMLMDAPPSTESPPCPVEADAEARARLGWNALSRLAASRVEAFAAVAGHLRGLGLSAPDILGLDAVHGFAVVEDLGERVFAAEVAAGADEPLLYRAAGEALAVAQSAAPAAELHGYGARWPLLTYDSLALAVNADLFVEWLPALEPDIRFSAAAQARWLHMRDDLIAQALAFPRVFTIRDYHAENLIWLPGREGVARVGLLDFQDAVLGWAGWDFMMLLQDARRDVGPAAQAAAVAGYLDRTGGQAAALHQEMAVLGALNSLRLLGLFARLVARDKKPRYASFMPRVWRTLNQNLRHPALAAARAFVLDVAAPQLERAG